jgi:hypothetical protein
VIAIVATSQIEINVMAIVVAMVTSKFIIGIIGDFNPSHAPKSPKSRQKMNANLAQHAFRIIIWVPTCKLLLLL